MFSKIRKILIILLILAITTWIIVHNPNPISVKLTAQKSFEAMGGVVILVTFLAGFLVAALFGILYGIKGYFRERGFKHKEQVAHKFYQEMLIARSAEAAGEYSKAATLWQALIKKDPTDIIARVELSKCLNGENNHQEALKVLDEARATDSSNVEVLLTAAESNVNLGNKTAALDNLALALYNHPNKEAARRARELSLDIGRIDDAIEYHNKYQDTAGKDEKSLYIAKDLAFRKILNDYDKPDDRKTALVKFAKRNSTFAPALAELATIEEQNGNIDTAAEYLIKAAKNESCPRYWIDAIKLWLKQDDSERALSTAKTSCRQNTGKSRFFLQCNYIRLLLDLQKQEDAQSELEKLESIAKEEGIEIDPTTNQQIEILKGYSLELSEDHKSALNKWRELSDELFGGALMTKRAHNAPSSHCSPKLKVV